MMNTVDTIEVDVLVVGAGPTGATAALALATNQVRVHAVTRFAWLSNTPRAHITNQRSMEVLRDLGVADEVALHGSPWELMGDTLFTTSLTGDEIARIRAWGTGDERHGDYVKASPCGMLDVPQPLLESVLVRNAAERGATFSFNTEYVSHEQDTDGVTTTLQDRLSGLRYQVRSRYLIGADGARSQIVEDVGLPVTGEMGRATTAYVQFRADLARYVAHRPSSLYWVMAPSAAYGEIGMGLLRAVRPWNEWIAGWGVDTDAGEPDLSDASVRERVRTLVGDPQLDPQIVGTSTWQVNQAYATHYSHGRVFCAGDAVHRHPPSGGLGSNICLQDAFNLAWKLALVLQGNAGKGLLDSYSEERAPVGEQVVLRANRSRVEFGPLNDLLQVEHAADPVAAMLEQLRDPSPDGAARREAFERALAMKNYEFNAHGVELNQRYISGAVLPDHSVGEEVWERDRELYHQASTRPGAKLPHAWLVGSNGTRVSTLDVVGGSCFSLVTGIAGTAWAEAAHKLDLPYLRVVTIGTRDLADLYRDWQRLRDVHEAGALLVRPDGYIAWRQSQAVWDVEDARAQIEKTLGAVLDSITPVGAR